MVAALAVALRRGCRGIGDRVERIRCGSFVQESELAGAVSGDAENLAQTRLIDRRMMRVPATDTRFVLVDYGNPNMRVLKGDNSGSRTTCRRRSMVSYLRRLVVKRIWGS
jgi:hypothetical protein